MKLTDIKGIGPKTEALMNRLGIFTPEDLVRYYPAGYDLYQSPVAVSAALPGGIWAVEGTITGNVSLRRGGRSVIVTTTVCDPTGALQLIWFNAPFMANVLKKGSSYVFRGRTAEKNGKRMMQHPEVIPSEKYRMMENTLLPVYSLTKGLTGKTLSKAVRNAMEADLSVMNEFMPEPLMHLLGLPDETEAIRSVHFPESADAFERARLRLVFDEFFLFIMALRTLKQNETELRNEWPMKTGWETEELMNSLPYRLTDAQVRVWREIESDLAGETRMSRLIQGDVGSGKTILAFLAMVMTAENGYQSALMAPTEVLARQHFEKLKKLTEDLGITCIRPALLTGSLGRKEREEVYRKAREGSVNAVIGTHALIEDAFSFRNLALVVTDEQHRFGVRQRQSLTEKGRPPHTVVMSATPIPRTLGVILYGDLDVSIIDELPARRIPIKNAVVDMSYRDASIRFISKETGLGRQAYIICPMIEQDEELGLCSVMEETEKVRKELPERKVAMLHGRMKNEEKNAVMESFARGETDILVSTTVVEVGVDVPNASVMLIENAERFGLAQLHQLRGRVGRGETQSYCVFMAGQNTPEIMERLGILQKSNSGFDIAEKDFELRGPGDLLGIRQSGDAMFTLADPLRDRGALEMAGRAADAVMRDDPALLAPEHHLLSEELKRYLRANERNITL